MSEEIKQVKGILYEEEKMNQALALLNTIPVSGANQVKAMMSIFEILCNPIPFKNVEEDKFKDSNK
jgi:hypothetical protein